MGSMQPDTTWPFPAVAFPSELLAIVQRTVAEGQFPALMVIHDEEDDWLLCDSIHDPNADGASIVTHIDHVLAQDSSIAELAGMPPGHIAERSNDQSPWEIRPWTYPSDEET
ncbi:hypothetical protein OHB41_17960 [Streptomyces sp. NBC_01571]|uniref:hypothetical protein n=1 Tax=Streptomyces sp. NBC_01571 TaxID=2975883 RepID=UPI002252A501|nr:hypothetical protein [Streptomyces sp. NBC_01571]MCX4575039.1 hypothetical protein [Streptomyces sp. NBC_01571]